MSAANQLLLLPYQLVQASLESCRILEYVGDKFPHEGFGFYGPQGFALRASILQMPIDKGMGGQRIRLTAWSSRWEASKFGPILEVREPK